MGLLAFTVDEPITFGNFSSLGHHSTGVLVIQDHIAGDDSETFEVVFQILLGSVLRNPPNKYSAVMPRAYLYMLSSNNELNECNLKTCQPNAH